MDSIESTQRGRIRKRNALFDTVAREHDRAVPAGAGSMVPDGQRTAPSLEAG